MADDPDVRSTKSGVSLEDHNLKNWIDRQIVIRFFSFARNYNKAIYECLEVCQFFGTNSKEHSESTSTNSPDLGRGARQLVAAVGDAIKDFTDKVELIADCKGIHDHLHEILDKVVRPLHDVVLPLWREEDRLQDEIQNQYVSRLLFLAKREGALKAALEGPTSKLKKTRAIFSVPPRSSCGVLRRFTRTLC